MAFPDAASNTEDPVEELEDEELKALELPLLPNADREGARKTLTKSYVDWLRLTVAHFDAAEIIIGYVMSERFKHQSISVHNLATPSTSAKLYPWRDLITDFLPRDPTSHISNAQILAFLTKSQKAAIQAKNLSALANTALGAWNSRGSPNFKGQQVFLPISQILAMLAAKDSIWQIAENVCFQLKFWPSSNDDAITRGIQELHGQLFPLPASTAFFTNLENLKFEGALHCKACLASLIQEATEPVSLDNEYAELLRQLKVMMLSNS